MHANTYRVLLQNVKVICKKKNSFPLHNHHVSYCCWKREFLYFPCVVEDREKTNKMKRIKSALNFIVVNKIHLNISWTVVAWISSSGPVSAFTPSLTYSLTPFLSPSRSLSRQIYLHSSERQTYHMHISHQCVQHCSLFCASTWPYSTFIHSMNFMIFSCVRVVCVCERWRAKHLLLVLLVYLQVAYKFLMWVRVTKKNQFFLLFMVLKLNLIAFNLISFRFISLHFTECSAPWL